MATCGCFTEGSEGVFVGHQLGTVRSFDYDLLGRPIHDCVTTLGTGVDGTVHRLSTTYEVRGLPETLTSWDNAAADYGAHVGGTVLLDLPEMAAVGPAEVLAIDDSPRIEPGPGQLITGTFHHTAAEVYNLQVASERETLGVTGTHPFWSVDRRAWVPAADLEVEETLKTLDGTTVVESIERRPEPEPVCNIEVEGDHVYRVGTSGVLVHNQSVGVTYEAHSPFANPVDGCGGAIANYIFKVGGTGVIIQRVKIASNAEDCKGNAETVVGTSPAGYFEAWDVKAGVIYDGAIAGGATPAFDPHDSFRIPNVGQESEGDITIEGTVIFVPGCHIDLKEWTGRDARAGGLPNLPLTTPPSNWNAGTNTRELISEWVCCDGKPKKATNVSRSTRL